MVLCRGSAKASEKCPIAIADLVLMYNRAMEGLYSKIDPITFDFYAGFPGTKPQFLKYCRVFERRLCSLVQSPRVIPVIEDHCTSLDVAGFITEWKGKGKNTLHSLKIELQFLEHHKMQFLDLHRELAKIEYSPQSEAALQNFKTLLLLEIPLLLGCDVDWAPARSAGDEASAVLSQSAAGADNDNSDDAGAADVASAGGANVASAGAAGAGQAIRPATRRGAAARVAADADAAAGGAADEGGADAGDAAAALNPDVVDIKDFTTWAPHTWSQLPFDEITFPNDPNISICSVRSYMALAMILWYDSDLRGAQRRLWDELNLAWSSTFHSDLHPHVLEKWPVTGPHAFSKTESTWLSETLRFLKKSSGRPSRARPPPASSAQASVPRSSSKAEGRAKVSKKRRASDPVATFPRFASNMSIFYSFY